MKNRKWMFLLVIVTVFQTIKGQERKVIIIDPGHGGIDSGAISKNGLKEKNVVLDIAMHMQQWNSTLLESEFDIYFTRSKDSLISLGHRTLLAQHIKPNVFISLHCNHATNRNAIGIEVYVYANHKQKKMAASYEVANHLINGVTDKLGFKNRGVKKANFQVLRETINSCPAVLLELGFLSNSNEADYLSNNEKRKALALSILLSIGSL